MKGKFDTDHVMRQIDSCKSLVTSGYFEECLERARKLDWYMEQHNFKGTTGHARSFIGDVIKALEREIATMPKEAPPCEECKGPLDDEAIDGLCSKCLDSMMEKSA